jgi:hypothetical protein
MGQFHPCLGGVSVASKRSRRWTGDFSHSEYSAYLWAEKRADKRTRTADLLITSDNSCVAGVCRGLQITHI